MRATVSNYAILNSFYIELKPNLPVITFCIISEQIWDKNGKWQQSLIGHTQQVNSVEFSPQNGDKIASSSRDDTVKLWTWQGKQYQLEKTISRQSPLESSSSVSFNPNIQGKSAAKTA